MREFFILTYDSNPELVFVDDYELGDFDDLAVVDGECPAAGIPDEVKLVVDETRVWNDFIANPLSWMIFSTRFRDVMAPFWDEGEFTGIRLYGKSGKPFDGFWLGTMQRRINCMDRERSDFRERAPGDLDGINELVVVGSAVPDGVHAFALGEEPGTILVDGEVKAAIAASGVKGLALIRCDVS